MEKARKIAPLMLVLVIIGGHATTATVDPMPIPAAAPAVIETTIVLPTMTPAATMVPTAPPVTPAPTPTPTPRIAATDAEIELLARVIFSEARGEPYEGNLMVAQCALDRLDVGTWGGTLTRVLRAKGQFAAPGRLTEDCLAVARAAVDGERAIDGQVLYFRATKSRKNWHAPYIGHVGGHAVYGYEWSE